MVKTKLVPKTKIVSFEIPESYVGHELQILAYSDSEVNEIKNDEKPNGYKLMKYVGIISKERGEEIQTYLKEARAEWDRDIF